jgi:electron transport complex protein RnfD
MPVAFVSSPHSTRINHVDQVMLHVCLALIPGIFALFWLFGWGVIINIVLAAGFAVIAEAMMLLIRRQPVFATLKDLTAVLTALLFAVTIPPTMPWWLTLLGISFAIIIVKQLYGGLGYNPFNPAMAGYVFLLISYPVATTNWLPAQIPDLLDAQQLAALSLTDSLQLIFSGTVPAGLNWDSISGATPLDYLRTQLDLEQSVSMVQQSPLWGLVGGRGWEWAALGFLLGGLYLLRKRVITWHIPVSFLTSLTVLAGLFWIMHPEQYAPPSFHLFSGAAMLGAFFIATDPVTACTTKLGQLIFGALIGLIVFVVRTWGGYPDAVAFSVLLMNIAAPLLEHYTQPRVFGQRN